MESAAHVLLIGGAMLTRTCTVCGGIHKQGERCPQAKRRHKEYDRTVRNQEAAAFYHSKSWRRLRQAVMATTNGIDRLAMHQGRFEKAELVHHIIPLEERPDLGLTIWNLIPVSNKSHGYIGKVYDAGGAEKRKLQELLFRLVGGDSGLREL